VNDPAGGERPTLSLTPEQAEKVKDYFIDAEPPYWPSGNKILVQQRRTPAVTKGGIMMADDTRTKDDTIEAVCRIVAFGPMVWLDEFTGEEVPGAPWHDVGDYVLVPRTSSSRYIVPVPDRKGEEAVFRFITLKEIFGSVIRADAILR
jgi:co-chaperonin GroES (HSP10)